MNLKNYKMNAMGILRSIRRKPNSSMISILKRNSSKERDQVLLFNSRLRIFSGK